MVGGEEGGDWEASTKFCLNIDRQLQVQQVEPPTTIPEAPFEKREILSRAHLKAKLKSESESET